MRIAIKATHITSGGGLTHLNKIIEWFGKLAPEIQFELIGKKGQNSLFLSEPGNFDYRYYDFPARSLAAQLWWERYHLPEVLRELRCGLLFEPGNYGTLSASCPKITLVHNLAPFDKEIIKNVSLYQKTRLNLLRNATVQSIQTSDGIIFLSNFAREVISKYVDLRPKYTRVIYHGAPEPGNSIDLREISGKYGIQSEFILCVSHFYRYKHIMELAQGYIKAAANDNSLPPLIIAGAEYDHEYASRIKDIINQSNFRDRIKLIGPISELELGAFYASCKFFIFPSILENCPNILIEALGNGCAVLCSNAGVMPEICGEAALYFDASDIDDIAAKLYQANSDESLLGRLKECARIRARYFSWEKTARETLEFFERILNLSGVVDSESKIGELVKTK